MDTKSSSSKTGYIPIRPLWTTFVGFAVDTEGFDDGSLIRTETRYDVLRRVDKKSRPYFVTGGTPVWTSFTHDTLGRVVTATEPNGAVTSNAYHGLTTSVTNAASQTSTTTKNSQGQVMQVKDTQNNTTSYQYEPFGNLPKVTNAAGNVTTSTYDTRGRKIAAATPTWAPPATPTTSSTSSRPRPTPPARSPR